MKKRSLEKLLSGLFRKLKADKTEVWIDDDSNFYNSDDLHYIKIRGIYSNRVTFVGKRWNDPTVKVKYSNIYGVTLNFGKKRKIKWAEIKCHSDVSYRFPSGGDH